MKFFFGFRWAAVSVFVPLFLASPVFAEDRYDTDSLRFPAMKNLANGLTNQAAKAVAEFNLSNGELTRFSNVTEIETLLHSSWQNLNWKNPENYSAVVNGVKFRAVKPLLTVAALLSLAYAITPTTHLDPGMDRVLIFTAVAILLPMSMAKAMNWFMPWYAKFLTEMQDREDAAVKKYVFFETLKRRGFAVPAEKQGMFFSNFMHALQGMGCPTLLTKPAEKVRVLLTSPEDQALAEAIEEAAEVEASQDLKKQGR